jgi:beta-galactosidase/beta-glucuronidase
MSIPRPEYPRPDLVRADWFNLNGEWQFTFDDENRGLAEGWQSGRDFDRRINVPFVYQAPLSGIGGNDLHHILWYRRTFEVPSGWYGRRVKLNFGAVDFEAQVYVNGKLAATHRGGHTPFCADITPLLALDNHNELVVRVYDDERLAQPRGKQYWKKDSGGIWYTRSSGIWQTVWLEPVGEVSVQSLRVNSWDSSGRVEVVAYTGCSDPRVRIRAEAIWNGNVVACSEAAAASYEPTSSAGRGAHLFLQIPSPHLWSQEHPNLYDLNVTVLRDGQEVDRVLSYFGIRSLRLDGGTLLLNEKSVYQRLVLDQGYWPNGLMTAPSDDELKADILRMKEMGFNGCRKHMKVEDPRFLYWADKLGYLVWGEMAACWEYSDLALQYFIPEWQEAILRDRNHPCIITWTPINESWGVDERFVAARPDQLAFLDGLYHLTRALDPTRPVNGNDGWQNPLSDLATIHDYAQNAAILKQHMDTYVAQPNAGAVFSHGLAMHLPGNPYRGQPILVTEYGGIGLVQGKESWGYGQVAGSAEELLARFDALTTALQQVPRLVGYCYTQLSDVEQEENGLYTYDRKPKLDPAKVREINERRRHV